MADQILEAICDTVAQRIYAEYVDSKKSQYSVKFFSHYIQQIDTLQCEYLECNAQKNFADTEVEPVFVMQKERTIADNRRANQINSVPVQMIVETK